MMNRTNQIIGILALSAIKGIGPAFVKKVVTGNMFYTSSGMNAEIKNILSSSKKEVDESEIHSQIDKAKEILSRCQDNNIEIIPIISDNYPIQLKAIKDPPPIIYCKGNMELLRKKIVCIIGTREPNDNGSKIAERVGQYFSANLWSICNGLAEGIDYQSIKLNENIHSNVIGILSGGLNYKQKNTLLKSTAKNADLVLSNKGLLISEMPLDKKEDTFSVIKSCRIQAGISGGMILIQSPLDGGSRFTTKAFCELSRPLAIINPIHSDLDLPKYSANKEIIENYKNGLAKFANIKIDKIQTSTILIIKSKEDYPAFERLIEIWRKSTKPSYRTLFD